MIEQYIYNRITQDDTLQTLLDAGGGDTHLYPAVVPRGVEFERAVTFTLIGTYDEYPTINSVTVQFNIFAASHTETAQIAAAIEDLFNEDNRQQGGDVDVIFSIRKSESDLGFDYDSKIYHREATYYFKLR